jgi:protein-S-isoprenylcysteine O-methyltransferase Ste14
MDTRPIVAYLICLLIYRFSESAVMIRVGSWKRTPKWEWTLPLVIGSFVLILISPVFEYISSGREPGPVSYLLGGMLFLAGTVLRVKGHLDLKRGFFMAVEMAEGQTLVDTGIYSLIRHPLYLGTLCLFFACPIFLAAHLSFIFTAAGVFAIFVRIRREEAFLVENMPGYREYMNRTGGLLPNIRSRRD